MTYVGLTDDPERRKQEHRDPSDWRQCSFSKETDAREWEKDMLAMPDHSGGSGGEGWRCGYTYTITPSTRQ